jgi:PKD repeat protein
MKKSGVFLTSLLFVSFVLISCTKEQKEDPPIASFTSDKTSGNAPLTVNFSSTSRGTITSYSWSFGDGGTSTNQNPSHTFSSSGSNIVTLTVTGPGGSDSGSNTITVIQAQIAPVSSFTSDKTSGNAPLTVDFTSNSTGTITAYSWNFGDGGTSTNQNPSHTFSSAGTYTVTLTVTGPGGSNSGSNTITVTLAPAAPVSSFTSDKTSGNAPLAVNFTSTSTGSITSYSWNFGDGGTSANQNPSHTFSSAGTYTVTLTVTGPGGSNASSKTITVTSGTNITFYNPVFTTIQVTCNGLQQSIPAGGNVTYYSVPGTSVNYSASTYGATTSGTQVGLKLAWNGPITLSGGNLSFYLNVPSTYFFLNLTNSSASDWVGLYVNYGLVSQSYDAVEILNNGFKNTLGYYYAYSNSNVRVYSANGLLQWNWYNGTNFTLPGTANQLVSLSGTKSKSLEIDENSNPAQSFIKKDPNAIDLYCK